MVTINRFCSFTRSNVNDESYSLERCDLSMSTLNMVKHAILWWLQSNTKTHGTWNSIKGPIHANKVGIFLLL